MNTEEIDNKRIFKKKKTVVNFGISVFNKTRKGNNKSWH